MSATVSVTAPVQPASARPAPPLENGDRLTRAEFERRYAAMPGVKKAELIEGIVHMPSPVRIRRHGVPHAHLITWLGHYAALTPGLILVDNSTDRLDEDNEPQPDAMLLIPKSAGGATEIDPDDYLSGPPELVCEVAASSVSIDMHAKLHAYRRNGVKEYLVWRTEDGAVDWFILREGLFVPLPAQADGVIYSETFPGLCLDPAALLKHDLRRLFELLEASTRGEHHATFVRRLVIPA
jgi:Uma2 family endonuclease